MPSFPPPTPAVRVRLPGVLGRLLRRLVPRRREWPCFVSWAEMRPIDFDGEDTSLTEAELLRRT